MCVIIIVALTLIRNNALHELLNMLRDYGRAFHYHVMPTHFVLLRVKKVFSLLLLSIQNLFTRKCDML